MTGKKEGTRKYREIVTPVIRQPETRSQRNQEPLSDTQKKSAMELKKKVRWDSLNAIVTIPKIHWMTIFDGFFNHPHSW